MSSTAIRRTVNGHDIMYEPDVDGQTAWYFIRDGERVVVEEYEGHLVILYAEEQRQIGDEEMAGVGELRDRINQMQASDGLASAKVLDESFTKWFRLEAQGIFGAVRYLNRIVSVTDYE